MSCRDYFLINLSCIFAAAIYKCMKQRIKYGLLGLLFLLLNSIALRAYTPARPVDRRSDISYIISQEEATHNAIRFLYFIYSNTPREAVSIDNQSLDLKHLCKPLFKLNNYKSSLLSAYLPDRSLYAHLHPDPVKYYIYALERIVI